MQQFQDTAGRTWQLTITVGTIKRVRGALADRLPGRPIDLLKIDEGQPPLVSLLSIDAELLVDVIFEIVRQAPAGSSYDFTPEAVSFAESMGGQAMLAATAAFWGELRDFFQSLGRRDLVQVIATQADAFQAIMERTAHDLASLDLGEVIDQALARAKAKQANPATPGNGSTSSPALPASIPNPSPGASYGGWPGDGNAMSGIVVPD